MDNITIKEIARRVGVSPSTVSRVINRNNEKCASKDVRERIWQIVQESGYIPNKNAQLLKQSGGAMQEGGRKGTFACIFARVKDIHNDQFFNTIYRVAEKEAFKRDYLIQHAFSLAQYSDVGYHDMMQRMNVDGILVLGRAQGSLITYLNQHYRNLIYVGLNLQDTAMDQVYCDGYLAASSAVQHLYQLRHHKIGYIGEMYKEIRYKGYCEQMQKLNLAIDREHLVEAPLTMDGGYQGAIKLLSRPNRPTGVFCCNDVTAVGAIKAIKEAGLRIPEDISIVSIDGIEMASYVNPMLTTIGIPQEEMGKMAVKILIDRIEGGHRLPIKIEFPFKIINRESCAVKQDR